MAKKDLEVNIKAKVTGTDDVEELGKAVGELDDKPYDVDLRLKGTDDIEDDLRRIRDELAETAAKAVALGRETVTFRVDTTQLERVSTDVTELATDLKRIDDQTVDITFRSDQLDDVGQRLRTAKADVDGIGKSADSSRSALANMIGNSAQDLGALAGIAGSAGVAIGQMGEYAADARLAGEGLGAIVKSFAGVALPIAALSIGIPLATAAWQHFANAESDAEKKTKELTKALKEQQGTVEELNLEAVMDAFSEWGTVMRLAKITSGELNRALLGDARAREGVIAKLNDFRRAHQGNNRLLDEAAGFTEKLTDELDTYRESNQATFRTELDRAAATGRLNQNLLGLLGPLADAADTTTEWQAALDAGLVTTDTAGHKTIDYAKAIDLVRVAAGSAKEPTEELATATGKGAEAARDYAEAVTAADKALKDQMDTLRSAADATIAVADATDDWAQFLDEIPAKVAATEGDQRKLNDLNREATRLAADMADAIVRQATEQAKANGTTLSTSEAQKLWNESMTASANTLSGPMNDALVAYIAQVNGIPRERITTILADTDPNNLDQVEKELAALEKTRFMDLFVRTHGWAVDAPGGFVGNEPSGRSAARGTTVVNQNIRVNAGVGTNPFALERAVHKATVKANRLKGIRP